MSEWSMSDLDFFISIIRKIIFELVFYNVNVKSISTMRYAGKSKVRYTRAGMQKGRTNAFKKAIVTLAEGEMIDFYSNI